MPDRKRLVSALWLTLAPALLAAVLVAPIRTTGFLTVSSRPDCLGRDYALPPLQPTTCLSQATPTEADPEVKALATEEDEEQHRAEALDGPRASFLTPSSFRKVPDRQSIAPRSILSHYPLRC